ncbi:hypothetical protein P6F26_13300 [Roseibacterium sp. SDUM158017]|nr:hypothetical protein [Roseibacterium sp. SDUM158017]
MMTDERITRARAALAWALGDHPGLRDGPDAGQAGARSAKVAGSPAGRCALTPRPEGAA